MTFARTFLPVIVLAVLAACSGNLGGGQSTLPGAPQAGGNVQQLAAAVATATPVSASNVATVGDSVAPQALPTVMGWGGSITFPKPAPAATTSTNPKAAPSPSGSPAASNVSIGVTAAVVEPSDSPHLYPATSKHRPKGAPGGLLYVSLLATSDVMLSEYPKIAFDMPRDIMTAHRADTFALALFDPGQSEKAYALAIADRDLSSPLPGSLPSSTPAPSPSPTATAMGVGNGIAALTPPPIGSQLGSDSLPPERVAFAAKAASLTLKANRPIVFALYAVPPSPTPKPSATPRPSPSPTGSPSPAPSSSASPPAPATPTPH